jgi:hypothetical protein
MRGVVPFGSLEVQAAGGGALLNGDKHGDNEAIWFETRRVRA